MLAGRITTTSWIKIAAFVAAALVLLSPFIAFGQNAIGSGAQANPQTASLGWIEGKIVKLLYDMVVMVFGTLAGWAGMLLNYAVYFYTLGFGAVYLETGLGAAIDDLWSTVRDVFNLTFIFGLVYIGLMLIINSEDSKARRGLIYLIGAALLVNFSLFFTKAIIDISHVLTDGIIQGFQISGASAPNTVQLQSTTIYVKDLSGAFVNLMDLSSVFQVSAVQNVNITSGGAWGLIFLTMIILLIATFVFAAGAFLLIVRFIALNFFMVLSPVMFLGWVFPSLSNFSSEWWRKFLRSAFLAPAYIFLLYMSAQILTSFKAFITAQSRGGLGGAITAGNEVSLYSIVPFYVVTAGFLLGSVIIAQQLGVAGSAGVMRVGQNLQKRGQNALRATGRGAVRGTAGYAARGTGWVAEGASRRLDRGVARLAQSNRFGARALARTIDDTVGAGVRRAQGASIAGSETLQARRDRQNASQQRFNQRATEAQRADDLTADRARFNAAGTATEAERADRRNAFNAVGSRVRRMSNEEVLLLSDADLNSSEIAGNLTDAHITALRDSGRFNNQQSTDLRDSRNDSALNEATVAFGEATSSADELNNAFNELRQTLANMSTERKQSLGATNLSNERVAVHLTDRDIEQFEQSGQFSTTEIQNIRNARNTARNNLALGRGASGVAAGAATATPAQQAEAADYATRRQRALFNNPTEAGRLAPEVIAARETQPYLTPEIVEQRMRNGITNEERIAIQENVNELITDSVGTDDMTRIHQQWRQWVNRSSYGAALDLTSLREDEEGE